MIHVIIGVGAAGITAAKQSVKMTRMLLSQ